MSTFPTRLAEALVHRYRIEVELGKGGMAVVYRAHDLRHDRPVALKVFHPDLVPGLGDRFLREIRVAAGLRHPRILTVHDSGEADGLLWYTMPLVEGESLRDRLRREGQLPVDEAVRIGCAAADALDFAHRHGVVHRDIKPENILLFAGEPMIADFGIAMALDRADDERLTRTGLSLGTPAYMSPEQALADARVDARSDVYSLGCVVYEMLAGEPPYTGPTPQAIVARRLTEPLPRLRTVRDVPEALEQAIHRALARNPADRYQSAGEFARALASPPRPVPQTAARSLPKPGRRAGHAALALLAVGAATWLMGRPRAPAAEASRVAVLPFSVAATGGHQFLAQGMVDLLSRNLSGTQALAAVDPGRVIALAGAEDARALDTARARDLARRLGAAQFVTGSVVPAGPRLRIQAHLYRQDTVPIQLVAQGAVEGDSTELFGLVDQLTAQLLVRRGQGQGARLAETAAISTRSLPALKAYLEGERNLRAARYDSAIAGFQLATELDSGFALAHYRLGVAAMWVGRQGLLGPALQGALAHVGRLNPRDRRLVLAFADMARGQPDRAEQQYRDILDSYPDDLEARFQLGNLLYIYNAARGRPPAEAREQYVGVLRADPKFICPI